MLVNGKTSECVCKNYCGGHESKSGRKEDQRAGDLDETSP